MKQGCECRGHLFHFCWWSACRRQWNAVFRDVPSRLVQDVLQEQNRAGVAARGLVRAITVRGAQRHAQRVALQNGADVEFPLRADS